MIDRVEKLSDELTICQLFSFAAVKPIDRRDPEVIEQNIKLYQTRLANGCDLWTGDALDDIIVQELKKYRKPTIQ